MWPFSNYSLNDIASFKQAQRRERLASVDATDVESVNASAILRANVSEIVTRIEVGEWTAAQVLDAYIQRATFAHKTTNCLSEVLFTEAREQAEALDRDFAITKTLKGPLHGVPVSFKDCFNIKGYDSTIGLGRLANSPRETDAELVSLVRAAGGIPFVKTNVCQTMMTFECINPIWGRTTHPQNPRYTCGGSSGGEAALLAMDGSPLGFGSDIGGSVRIPAAYCGIYSLRPGAWRISGAGMTSAINGFEGIPAVMGPMGRSVDDLELACRVVFGKGRSYNVSPMPFRDVSLPLRLRFGYYVSDGFIKASPACRRAVLETVEALTREGHECVPIVVPQPSTHMELFVGLIAADGYETLFGAIGRDPVDSGLSLMTVGPKLWGWLRSLLAYIIGTYVTDKMFARCLRASRKRSVAEYWELVAQRDDYKKLFYDKVWETHQLDGIIAPVQALPQGPHGICSIAPILACGTILYNVLNLPAGVVPVTLVDPALDKKTTEWTDVHLGQENGSLIYQLLLYHKLNSGGVYDAQDMAGMPVSVQVVGRQWEDEKVVGMMRVVDRALGPRCFGPGTYNQRIGKE